MHANTDLNKAQSAEVMISFAFISIPANVKLLISASLNSSNLSVSPTVPQISRMRHFLVFNSCSTAFIYSFLSVFLYHTHKHTHAHGAIREPCPRCFISLVTFVSPRFVSNHGRSERKGLRLCVCSLIKAAVPLSPDDTSKSIQAHKHASTCKYVVSQHLIQI